MPTFIGTIAPDGTSQLKYKLDDPSSVQGVPRLRGYVTAARTGAPAFDIGPGIPDPSGTPGLFVFSLPANLPPALYFTDFTVTYTDGSSSPDRNDTFVFPFVDSGLVSIGQYQRFTGDTTSPAQQVADALLDAQGLVEEFLRRKNRLAFGTYTDRLRLYRADGIDSGYDGAYLIYPRATPVLIAPGFTVLGSLAVAGAFPDGGPFLQGIVGQAVQPYATITYTGGHTRDTLPVTIAREIAKTAQAALQPASSVPVGASSVRVGDVAVTLDARYVGGHALSPSSQAALRRYVRRRGA